MSIMYACPRCQHVMQAADDKGGTRTQCAKCQLAMEIPLPRGKLLEVRPAAALPSAVTTGPNPLKADDLLKEATARKKENDFDSAIQLLRQAFEEIRKANALLGVETFLRLPLYLQQAGRSREAWLEFNSLLFKGYPNQTRDMGSLARDRAKIFDKMRLFLERDGKAEIAAVFGVFHMVCKGIGLFHEDRRKELKAWFSKTACTEYVAELKKYTGSLGRLQGIFYAVVEELGEYPNIDFEKLARRIDVTLRP